MRALITGAGSGLGREIAMYLAKPGNQIGLHYFSSKPTVGAEIFQADFRNLDAQKFAGQVAEKFEALDVLIHSASLFPDKTKLKSTHDFSNETPEHWDEVFAVNAKAPFFLTQALLPLLKRGANPTVINIFDTAASAPYLSRSAYSLSRSTLSAITKLLAEELSPGIQVYGMELGPVQPHEGMAHGDQAALKWSGYETVLRDLQKLLSDR